LIDRSVKTGFRDIHEPTHGTRVASGRPTRPLIGHTIDVVLIRERDRAEEPERQRPGEARQEAAQAPAPDRRRYVIFVTVCTAILMVSIDLTIVATALPTLRRELNTTLAWSSWTITIYQLGQIVSLPIAGRLSDSLGRRRMFLVYVSVFTLSSLLAGLSTNIYMLIALRFTQALGGGGLMPSTMGVVSDLFPRDRDRALGLVSSFFPAGALIGPTLGGLFVTYASWRAIFFINVPVGAAVLVLLWLLMPSTKAKSVRIDVVGAALLGAALLSTMFGLNQFAGAGVGSPLPWTLVAVGVAFVVVFLLYERRTTQAILPPALLRRPAFAVVNGINVLYGAAAFGIFSLVPLYAQLRYGLSPLAAGSLLSVRAVGMAGLSVASAMLLRRLGYRVPMVFGFVVLATGLALMSVPAPTTPLVWLAISALVCGAGVGTAGPPSNNAAVQLMPDQVAAISGLRAMFRQTGGILAITLTALAIGSGASEASTLERAFLVFSVLPVLVIPAVLRIPDRRLST
jgi:EmrB/QacA subfamily drug resistance transporter